MTVIDIHTHCFPDSIAEAAIGKLSDKAHILPFTDGTAEGLRSSMRKAGIRYSVIQQVATNPAKVAHVNSLSAELNGKDGLFYFACIHPDMEHPEEEIRRCAENGLRGIKLHPVYQNCDIDNILCLRILSAAAENNMTVLIHAGWDIGYPGVDRCSPVKIARAINEVGNIPLIAAHLGGWRMWDTVDTLLPLPSVYLDTSFSIGMLFPTNPSFYPDDARQLLSPEEALSVIRRFGSSRILFGSDSPWGSQVQSLSLLRTLPLAESEFSDILGGNAEKLLF